MKTTEFIDTDLESVSTASVTPSTAKNYSSPTQSQGRAEIDARVEQARQQMLELRRQQEELERQRQELEDLRRREEDFEKGKAEMLEELSRAVVSIEQEEFELNKRATMLTNCREVFQDYVRQLQDIHESEWVGDEIKGHLAKAASVLETARAELNKGRAQLSFLGEGPVKLQNDILSPSSSSTTSQQSPAAFDFGQEVMRGLARQLPLIGLGALALIYWLMRH